MKTTQQIESFFLGFIINFCIFGIMLTLIISAKRGDDRLEKLILQQENKELLRKLRKANTDIIAAREIIQGNKLGTLIYR